MGQGRIRRTTAGHALLLGLLALAMGALATPAHAAATGGPIVLTPKAGDSFPPGTPTIRIRAGHRSKLKATLNGTRIGGHFSRPRKGIRRLKASPNYGLRHRANVLRVERRRGGESRRQTVRFRVRPTAPLAAAGRKQRVALNSRFGLDGRESLPHRRRSANRLEYDWAVVEAPTGSDLDPDGARSDSAEEDGSDEDVESLGPPGELAGDETATPSLRPDQPGTYKLGLRVTAPDGAKGVDQVPLRVDPDPLVTVDTMAKPAGQATRGVKVGTQFFPDPGAGKQWLQLVALNAETLELVSNKSYDCPAATVAALATNGAAVRACTDALSADLRSLKANAEAAGTRYTVIAVSQRPEGAPGSSPEWSVQPPVGAAEALVPIGAPIPTWSNAGTPMLRGRMSVIGSLGGTPKRTVTHNSFNLDDRTDDGTIRGLLLRDNRGRYSSYASTEHPPFDTQAPESNAQTAAMRIGSEVVTSPIPAGSEGGFHVVIADRQDLGAESYFFDFGTLGDSSCPACPVSEELKRMTRTIADAPNRYTGRGQPLIFIQSRGIPVLRGVAGLPPGNFHNEVSNDAKALVDLLANRFGATRGAVFRAIDPGLHSAGSYSLVASERATAGEGIESSAPGPQGGAASLATTSFVGSLTRSAPDYGFRLEAPRVGEEPGDPGQRLRDVALSEPGNWPEQGDVTKTSALKWISDKFGWDTRRGQFWTQPYSAEFWDGKIAKLQQLAPPTGEVGFTAADFAWARDELIAEIGWLKDTAAYTRLLARAFNKTATSAWADVSSIASSINNDVTAPEQDKTLIELGLLFDALRNAATVIPGASEAISVVNTIYDTSLAWAAVDADGTHVDDPFEVSVAQAGSAAAKRLQTAEDTLENQLFDVIVADYRKLRTVGLCGSLDQTCPDGTVADWQVTSTEQDKAAQAVRDSTRVALYGAMMPAKYRAWLPPTGEQRSVNWNGSQPAGQTLLGWECPFHNLSETGQLAYPIHRQIGYGGAGDTWQVIAYAQRTGDGIVGRPYEMQLPGKSLTDKLFNARSAGGLGVDPETFYWRYMDRRRAPFFAPGGRENEYGFPLLDSQVRWITRTDPPGIKRPNCGY